jgi:hypothetical protein
MMTDPQAVMAKMGHMLDNDKNRSVKVGQVGENDRNRSVNYISMWDWTAAYHQQPLDEESRKVTAFSTRTQRVQFTRTPQGLRSSSWAFLSAVYDLFRQELRGNMAIYADDALLFNSSFQEHKKLLRVVLQKMKDKALRINPKKSKFATDRAIFLGFELSAHGLRIDPKRFQKIRDLQPATNVKQVKISMWLRKLLQKKCATLCNYYESY